MFLISPFQGTDAYEKGVNDMSEVKKHPGGRPRIFKNLADMQEKIDDYFDACEGTVLMDSEGNPVLDKYSQPVIYGHKPPTVTGLALALGFTSRQALLNYQERDEYFDAITRAKLRIEEYNETRLFDREGVNGAKFSLINNFKSWKEKQDIEMSGELNVIKVTPPKIDED